MSHSRLPDSLHSEAGVAEPVLATLDKVRPARLAMLDGGEIIELSLRPSLWYVALVCGRYVVACGILAAAAGIVAPPGQSAASALIIILCSVVALAVMTLAALQWASRLYVLTNRRVMRFKGVSAVELTQRPLMSLERVELHTSTQQGWLRIGTIRMIGRDGQGACLSWEHLAKPDQVYRTLTNAIQRARNQRTP